MRNLLLLASATLVVGCIEVQDLGGGSGGGSGNFVCVPDGDSCAAAADCCSGQCVNGACEAAPSCAPSGDACSADADCCSLLCVSGACSNGPLCAPDGDACVSNADCCSQQCSNGTCNSAPMCAADGDACTDDADCCLFLFCISGACSNGPQCAPDGDACASNVDCCSQQCSNGACNSAPMCGAAGDPCSDDADCCSLLFCIGGACSNGPQCAPDGDACASNADCCSQQCSSGACADIPPTYSTSFEGACPDGWTLNGDWECGVPMNVGPMSAYTGTQCIGTQIAANYHVDQTWNGTTATSPDIDLTNVPNPVATFRMWVDTEGATYDGVNLQISTDGGMNFSIVNDVMPAYPLTIAGKPAWGGHQPALGWQLIQADLSGFAGQIVRLRFAFRSDGSQTYPGVYIDDLVIN